MSWWQGPERGLEIKGHKPTWGVSTEVGSAGAHKLRPAGYIGKSRSEDLGGLPTSGKFILMVPDLGGSHSATGQISCT